MSGHSKWHSIRHKKAATDAARGKIFTRHAKLITIAARDGGGDPEKNPGLRLAIENARKENMPNSNIDRAIKKGTGENKSDSQFFELNYEGYAPGGVAVLVSVLTDNKNRTVAAIRSTFSKNGGNLGESGSVAFLFKKKGVIRIEEIESQSLQEEILLAAIEAGADDIIDHGNEIEILTDPKKVFEIKKKLENFSKNLSAKILQIPDNSVEISDESLAKKILKLMSELEENEDVSEVSANFDIKEEIFEAINK